ncbi:MAG: hypothetical protein HFH36_13680 [Lachnospiraceae bacterium]|nr:hypothetical protein [Lachnospiraceae bacterium]
MEEKKTLFDYLAQVFVIFGFSILVLNIFCLMFGNSAQEISTMFALGSRGIPAGICFQFLCISVLVVAARFVFFTDTLIRNMPIWLRTICMLATVIVVIVAFTITFRWFPADMWQSWAMFLLCFGISFLSSCFVMAIKEKMENRKMANALQKLKEQEEHTA